MSTGETGELLERASSGDPVATNALFTRHRWRLREMIVLRLDPQLAARVDPSDILQETYLDAARRLPEYFRTRTLPFYAWLRQIALDRLADAYRRHIEAEKRSVRREDRLGIALSDASIAKLARHLLSQRETPSGQLLRQELRELIEKTLQRLDPRDREVLVMRHLEQLSINEIAAVLCISEAAAKSRVRRALERFIYLLNYDNDET